MAWRGMHPYRKNRLRAESRSGQQIRKFEGKAILGMSEKPEIE